ncbi:MAG TPA: GDSL-type esterase/lipase family protein [Gemmatimonadales bacterium]|nr:GDSL-type esterase/lipase family protein [Gemmatimonadales bacterium]
MRYLALGDSYTVGEGVGAGESLPACIKRRMFVTPSAARGPKLIQAQAPSLAALPQGDNTFEIIARTGWTTAELAAAIRRENPPADHDLVTLLIGVNNQYRGLPLEEYRLEFAQLLATAVRLARERSRRVVVLSIPDWGVTPFAEGRGRERIAIEIDRFNDAAHGITTRAGAAWVDVTADSRAYPADLVADGLHPSAAAYERWAQLALPAVLAALADA